MQSNYWREWAYFLQRWGLRQSAAVLLETSGSLTALVAQLLYISQPVFGSRSDQDAWLALGELLENQQQSKSFAQYLREDANLV